MTTSIWLQKSALMQPRTSLGKSDVSCRFTVSVDCAVDQAEVPALAKTNRPAQLEGITMQFYELQLGNLELS